VKIVLALMAHSENRHGIASFDFVQGDLTRATEFDQHLTQKRVLGRSLATGKGKHTQEHERLLDGMPGTLCHQDVVLGQKGEQTLQIVGGCRRQPDTVVQAPAALSRVWARMASSRASISSALT